MKPIVVQLSILPPWPTDSPAQHAFRLHVLFGYVSQTIIQELCNTNAPNRANTRAGVPDASRIRTGKSGLYCLIVGYRESMNSLLEDRKQT
jgi:hypothetical protein